MLPLHHTLDALDIFLPIQGASNAVDVLHAADVASLQSLQSLLAMFGCAVMVLLTPAVWHCLGVLLPCRGGLQWSSGQRGQLGQQCAQGVTSHICCHSCRWRGSCCGSWQHILRGFDCWRLGGGVGQAGGWGASSTWPDSSGRNGSSIIRAARDVPVNSIRWGRQHVCTSATASWCCSQQHSSRAAAPANE